MSVPEKKPYTFYLPKEMSAHKAVKLLQKHKSITALLRAKLKRVPTKEEIDYFWLKICEERYKYDFEFFAISCITISDKQTKAKIRFRLNRAQRRLLGVLEKQRDDGRQIKVQILKARQMGFSTLIQMYMKWVQVIHKQNWDSVVCAHTRDIAVNVRSMYDQSINEMIPIHAEKYTIKSYATTHNIKIIPERGCKITVGFATEPESVRSQAPMMVHFSEEAFYPTTENNNPELLETSIVSAIPDVPFTLIVRESTANGVGDYFYEQWIKAKAGEIAYEAFFAAWFEIPLYDELFNGYYYQHNGRRKKGTVSDFIGTLNEYEQNLWNNHKDCTLENLNWRRMKAASMPSESKMKQEFPSDDIEAFQDSGSPVFKADDVEAMRKGCCNPVEIGMLQAEVNPSEAIIDKRKRKGILRDLRFVSDKEAYESYIHAEPNLRIKRGINKLFIWRHPDKEEKISNRYVVSFDPQRGTSAKADYGIIKVFDRYWMMEGDPPEVVAMFYGHLNMYVTIWIAAQVAKYYNDAKLVIESNTYVTDKNTLDTDDYIFDVIADSYPNLYSRTSPEKIVDGAPVVYGFPMYRGEKMMIIENYRTIIGEKGYEERDAEAYKRAVSLVKSMGHRTEFGGVADLAIAPLLTEKLTIDEIHEPWFGTLIFHPSPLPYGRGAASIKWAYRRKEPITAATWFWADAGLDTGPICEQEIIKIDYEKRPREFYEADILPAMERTLKRCLNGIQMGFKREIPQVEKYASYDRIK